MLRKVSPVIRRTGCRRRGWTQEEGWGGERLGGPEDGNAH